MKTNPNEWVLHLCTLIVQLKINRIVGTLCVRSYILFFSSFFFSMSRGTWDEKKTGRKIVKNGAQRTTHSMRCTKTSNWFIRYSMRACCFPFSVRHFCPFASSSCCLLVTSKCVYSYGRCCLCECERRRRGSCYAHVRTKDKPNTIWKMILGVTELRKNVLFKCFGHFFWSRIECTIPPSQRNAPTNAPTNARENDG